MKTKLLFFIEFNTLYIENELYFYDYIDENEDVGDDYVELTTQWIKHLLFEAYTMRYCIEDYINMSPQNFERDDEIAMQILNTSIDYGNDYEQILAFNASYNDKSLLKKYIEYISDESYINGKRSYLPNEKIKLLNSFGL